MNTDTHCDDTAATLDADITCVACDGNLRGTRLHGVCPHCGQPMGASIVLETIRQTDLTVATDVSCTHCSYNLRTMPISSRCPECGHEVIDSLRSSELRYAPLGWLESLRIAAMILSAAHAGPLVAIGAHSVRAPHVAIFAICGGLLLLGFGLIGISVPRPPSQGAARIGVTRAMVVTLVVTGSLLFGHAVHGRSDIVLLLFPLPWYAAGMVGLRCTARLARQERDTVVLRATTVSTILLVLLLLLLALSIGLGMANSPITLPRWLRGASGPALIALLGLLTYVATLTTSLACVSMLTQAIRAHNSATKPID